MGVPLQLILGLILAAVRCSLSEAPPPPAQPPRPAHNVTTELNNRDLNKIVVNADSKTENDHNSKGKSVLSSFPISLSKSGEDDRTQLNNTKESSWDSGEDNSKETVPKIREQSRAIDVDRSKFWSSNKNDVFPYSTFEGTRHPSFENNSELTTPTARLFDEKFKETVESVDQTLDEEIVDDDESEEEIEDNDLLSKKADNSTLEYEKRKVIVNNETVDKNSIHKDFNVQLTKKVTFENVYNESKTYEDSRSKGEVGGGTTVESTTVVVPVLTTRKQSQLKESIDIANGTESDVSPDLSVTIIPSTTARGDDKDDINLTTTSVPEKVLSTLVPDEVPPPSSQVPNVTTTTASAPSTGAFNISDQENTIPRQPASRKPQPSTTEKTTTETIPTTTTSDGTTMITYEGTTLLPEEGTTGLVIEITTITTTEVSDSTTETTSRSDSMRSSKSLSGSTEALNFSTESTIRNELDSTTLNDGKLNNAIEKLKDVDDVGTTTTTRYTADLDTTSGRSETTTELVGTTSYGDHTSETVVSPVEVSSPGTAQVVPQNVSEKPIEVSSSTTEFTFVHIEGTDSRHTTLLPEVLSPNLNYSTSTLAEDGSGKIEKTDVLGISTATPATATVTETNTEHGHTEHSFIKDGDADGSDKGKIAAIAISCVGAVCLILLAGLLYVMKKRQRRLNYGPRCRPVSLDDYSIDNLSVYNSVRRKGGARVSKRSFGNPAFDDPVAPTHPLNFQALTKFATNFEDVKAEFEDIPQITARTSELPEGCDTKNRYANVIPLPETRVFLNQIDGYPNSDYINANYVTGPKNIKGYYIATQGPMQNTVDDFWRMVWEQQAKVILMLTHLVENGLEKCVDYLPETDVLECSRLFGDFQITLKRREVKEKYIISSLQLKNMVSNSWREVTHFWYLGWPEKGVPGEAHSLIAFLIEARSYMKNATIDKKDAINGIQNGGSHNEHSPVVIHCSPGTGRTGVAIACDIAIREFETTRLVDIPKIVYKIRRNRANAIQNKEQYMFIYKVVSLYATKLTGGALENI